MKISPSIWYNWILFFCVWKYNIHFCIMWHEWPNGILYLISLSSPFMQFTFCAAPSFRFKLKSWAGTGCCLSVALFSHCLVTGLHNPFFSPHYMFHLPTYLLISKQVLHSTELCLQHSASSELCILNCDSFWQKTPLTGQQRECKKKRKIPQKLQINSTFLRK